MLPQIRPFDALVFHNVLGRSLSYQLSGVQTDDPLREPHDRAHDMLDHDDRDAALIHLEQNVDHFIDLLPRQSRHGFVRNQEFRLGRHRARKFEFPEFDLGQIRGRILSLVRHSHGLENFHGFGTIIIFVAPVMPHEFCRDHQILDDRHGVDRARNLETPCNTRPRPLVWLEVCDILSVEDDLAFLVAKQPGDTVDHRGLSRTVGADQAEPLTRIHMGRDIVESGKSPEMLRDTFDLE